MEEIRIKPMPADVPTANVPCGGCHACCQKDAVAFLMPDELEKFERGEFMGAPMTAKKANGDCVYLERGKGCLVHDDPPVICKAYDCAGAYKLYLKKFGPEKIKRHMTKDMRRKARRLLRSGYRPDIDLARVCHE